MAGMMFVFLDTLVPGQGLGVSPYGWLLPPDSQIFYHLTLFGPGLDKFLFPWKDYCSLMVVGTKFFPFGSF